MRCIWMTRWLASGLFYCYVLIKGQNIVDKIVIYTGYKKYFTLIFWKTKLEYLFFTGKNIDVVQTGTIEIDDDSEIAKLINGDK